MIIWQCWTKVLIETYWNVNPFGSDPDTGLYIVLIETYWNVNEIHYSMRYDGNSVLIETYWNVNGIPRCIRRSQPSINRNILECKSLPVPETQRRVLY